MLTGCDVSEIDSVQKALRAVSSWNDGVQNAIFRANHLAPTFSPAQVQKPSRSNAYYSIEDVKPVDGASWTLELAGEPARFFAACQRRSDCEICLFHLRR